MHNYAAMEGHKLMHIAISEAMIFTWLVGMECCDSHHTNVDSCPEMADCRMDQQDNYQVCWQNHLIVSWSQKGYKVRRAAGVREAAGSH